jgi:hypothetical protein
MSRLLSRDHSGLSRRLEIEYCGEWLAGGVAEEPLYDPRMKRVRVSAG